MRILFHLFLVKLLTKEQYENYSQFVKYNTCQKKLILEFFQSHKESLFTLEELIAALPKVGKSTIYRQIGKMEAEGLVKKLEAPFYQYLGMKSCESHLHLVCVECGKFIHLDDEISHSLISEIKEREDFEVSSSETTLYGVCHNCKGNKK